jgi:hypothetical protein
MCPHVRFLCPSRRYRRKYKVNLDKQLGKMKVEMEVTVSWKVTPCNLVEAFPHFRRTCGFQLPKWPKDYNSWFLKMLGQNLPKFTGSYPITTVDLLIYTEPG